LLAISVIASFVIGVSFSGAYAGSLIDTEDIANNAITTKKIAKDAVGKNDIKNNAIRTEKIKNNEITSDDLNPAIFTQTFGIAQQIGIGTTDVVLTPVATSFCALEMVNQAGDGDLCWMFNAGGNHNLRASVGVAGQVECRAHCFSWK